jgi:TolB-like protein/DNA-binding winged helix-turn-helix (wHTH) protein/tetratricopeptide (TPR) repeat protein
VDGDFRVGSWLVCPKLNTVQSDGRTVRIEHKMMQVLVCLASCPGEILSKEELIRTVWKDTFVTDEVLTRVISELRRIFSDDAKQPHMIETVARSGYRLIAPVEAQSIRQSRQNSVPKLIPLLALAVCVVAAFLIYPRIAHKASTVAGVRSIAVLPLENLSHDPEQEYFADGMTEALINNLSRIASLRVISRTTMMQYKTTHKPLPEIAHDLKVDAIVEGTVQRSGNRVRINAELIDGRNDAPLWARSFDRDLGDVLILESEVAQAVASELQVQLTPSELAFTHPVPPQAHCAYLQGRYLANNKTKLGLEQSIAFYQQAIDQDSLYAPAYAGLADSYILLEDDGHIPASEANPRIRSAALKAVAADPTLADAHVMLADARETEWDWAGAEQEYRRAIELNPGLPRAHHWYAMLLGALKRHDEAISEIERAVDLEPLSPTLYVAQAETYYLAGRYDQALHILNTPPILHGSEPGVAFVAGLVYLQKGEYEEAMATVRAAVDAQPEDADDLVLLGYAYARAGKRKEALLALDKLHSLRKGAYLDPGWEAMVWATLGNKDKALDLLSQDYQMHSSFMMWLGNPIFEPLRGEERFQNLLRRVGLP